VARAKRAVPGGSSLWFSQALPVPRHVGGVTPEIQKNISMEAFEIFEGDIFFTSPRLRGEVGSLLRSE
jgi:hypothetical protein